MPRIPTTLSRVRSSASTTRIRGPRLSGTGAAGGGGAREGGGGNGCARGGLGHGGGHAADRAAGGGAGSETSAGVGRLTNDVAAAAVRRQSPDAPRLPPP